MLSQILFKANKDLKNQAQQKAKQEGISLRALLTACLRAYVSGHLSLGLTHKSTQAYQSASPRLQKQFDRIAQGLNSPKNLPTLKKPLK